MRKFIILSVLAVFLMTSLGASSAMAGTCKHHGHHHKHHKSTT